MADADLGKKRDEVHASRGHAGDSILDSFFPWALSLFLLGMGMKLLMMQQCINPLPYYDQWDAEAAAIYVPYYEHVLGIADFFYPQSEHRIFFTHVYDLILLLLNGQWDSQLQMVLNAVIHCATIAGFGWVMTGLMGRRYYIAIWIPLAIAVMSPFGWENALWGFQSQFYLLLLFSLLTIWLLGEEPLTSRWRLGVATGACALLAMASGLLAAVAVAAIVFLEILKRRDNFRRYRPTLAACAALIIIGLLMKAPGTAQKVLHAHSVQAFLMSLGNNLSWPTGLLPWLAPLNLLPLLILAWVYFRSTEKNLNVERVVLGLGVWIVLQSIATAMMRGFDGGPPAYRYMDTLCFLLAANFWSIVLLLGRHRKALKFAPVWCVIFFVWLIPCAMSLWTLNERAWKVAVPTWAAQQRTRVEITRAFMATDEEKVFANHDRLDLPLFYVPKLVFLLRSKDIRPILPTCVRDPLRVSTKDNTSSAFIPEGSRLNRPDPPTEHCLGSWSAQGASTTGTFESAPMRSSLPYLEIPVAGDLGAPGLKLELVEISSGKSFSVQPARIPGGEWGNAYVKSPATEFKIVAHDESQTGWFAFKAPREMGRLSYWAMKAVGLGPLALAAGFLSLACAFVLYCLRFKRWATPLA